MSEFNIQFMSNKNIYKEKGLNFMILLLPIRPKPYTQTPIPPLSPNNDFSTSYFIPPFTNNIALSPLVYVVERIFSVNGSGSK